MSTTVRVAQGELAGVTAGSVTSWKGIPFAAAPTGALRHQPPAPAPAWEGVRDASTYGPVAPQVVGPMERGIGGAFGTANEDCLNLNVWAPAEPADAAHPVLVWIHGGAYMTGSGSVAWYDGTRLVERGDVVVVTVNYRLGALGFLDLSAHGGHPSSGNLGLLDQVAALEWVQANISAFGGDPANVTVFGESAGAGSIACLLAMPAARGLFAKAVLQSSPAAGIGSRAETKPVAEAVFAALGLVPGDLSGLAAAPVEKVLEAQTAAATAAGGLGMIWRPVLDGVALPEAPIPAAEAAGTARVPVLVGWNLEEMKLFAVMPGGAFDLPTDEAAAAGLALSAGLDASGAEAIVAAHRAALGEGASAKDVFVATQTDAVFGIPSTDLAERHARAGNPTFVYRFDWRSPVFGGVLGAAHALEIPFVFDNLGAAGIEQMTGTGAERQGLADAMSAAWLAFARTGDPGWPAYDPDGERTAMRFDATSEVVADPGGGIRKTWDAARAVGS